MPVSTCFPFSISFPADKFLCCRTMEDQPLDLSIKRDRRSSSLSSTSTSTEILQLLTKPQSRRMPCGTCGIGFSSEKTLQAHTEFYCAKKSAAPPVVSVSPAPSLAESRKSGTPVSLPAPETKPLSVAPVDEKLQSGHFCTHCAFRANTLRGETRLRPPRRSLIHGLTKSGCWYFLLSYV